MLGPLGPPHVENQALALKARGWHVHVGGNALEGLDDTVIEDAGIPVSRSPEGPRATLRGMASTVAWARRLRKEVAPDVVSAHWLPGFGFAAAASGAKPLALTAWGSDVYQASRSMKLAGRFALRRAELVMADSRDLLDACSSFGSVKRGEVIQWGVDLDSFTPADDRAQLKRDLGLGPGPVILSPRSFMPVYNIPLIIEAFEEVGDRFPTAQLVLKHMGPITIELPEFPHRDRVHVVGNVEYGEMANYYRAADLCVSLTSSDSSPRSVWEAMAAGATCVLSDLPWVTEMITPGTDAVTVPVSRERLADELCSLLEDEDRRLRIGAAGRQLVSNHLDREVQMDNLSRLLEELA